MHPLGTGRGNALMELGRFDEALNCYNEALHLEPKNDIFLSQQRCSFYRIKSFRRSNRLFKKSINNQSC